MSLAQKGQRIVEHSTARSCARHPIPPGSVESATGKPAAEFNGSASGNPSHRKTRGVIQLNKRERKMLGDANARVQAAYPSVELIPPLVEPLVYAVWQVLRGPIESKGATA
jgi:hypothetical protein